jgi:hypothetical protein
MPFSRSVGSNVPRRALLTGVLPELIVVQTGATPASFRLYSIRQVEPSLTVPTKPVALVIVAPGAGKLMVAVGGAL